MNRAARSLPLAFTVLFLGAIVFMGATARADAAGSGPVAGAGDDARRDARHDDGAAASWQQVMRNDKVAVFTRTRPGSAIKEIKATGIVDVPAWILKNVVDDIEGYTKLIPYTTEAKIVGTDGDRRVSFQRLEMPFTQAREYVVVVDDASYAKPDGRMVYRTAWTTAAPRFQHLVSDKAIRVTQNDGSWTFEELADGRTRATFSLSVDPEGELPKPLVNIAQRLTIAQYLDNLERRASLAAYRAQPPAESVALASAAP